MGLWDKIKGAAETAKAAAVVAKCMAGFHKGEYRPVKDKPQCNLEMTCSDCYKHLTKIEHEFGEWGYVADDKCDLARSCIHCGEQEKDVKHKWGPNTKENCKLYRCCERCGIREFLKDSHDWVRTKESCLVTKECRDCDVVEVVGFEHGPWVGGVVEPDGYQQVNCAACAATQRRKINSPKDII
jgi:hypothetical protein